MKKILLPGLTLSMLVSSLNAQIIGNAGYLPGQYVNVGVAGNGGFEGADTAAYPASGIIPGLHSRTNTNTYLGFTANPQMNGWLTFNGDFFTPGTPENGWGIELNGPANVTVSNNRVGDYDIPGGFTGFEDANGCLVLDWEGNYVDANYNLHIKVSYQLKRQDLFYTTTVTMFNNGSNPIPDLYYYRNVDPDNNITLPGGSYSTTNTIVSQPNTGCSKALVSATQSGTYLSYMGFAAIGPEYRVSKGGFANRDASNIWNGTGGLTGTVGSVSTSDEAISLAYRTQNLAPGDSAVAKFVVILDASQADNAINSLFYFNYAGGLGSARPLCSTHVDSVLSCPGKSVSISIAGENVSDFTWTWSPATGLSATTGTSVVASPDHDIIYTATGTPTDPCFTSTIMADIVVWMDTVQDVNFGLNVINPNCGLPNGSLEVTNITGGIGPVISIQWAGGPSTNLYENLPEGTYSVTLIDSFGCRKDSTYFLQADPVEYAVVIPPNVFTPNGDGRNDRFVVNGTFVTNYRIRIFNRWGQEVFTSDNLEKSWDGKAKNGSQVADGVYMYTIEYDNPCETPTTQTRHGSIHLLR